MNRVRLVVRVAHQDGANVEVNVNAHIKNTYMHILCIHIIYYTRFSTGITHKGAVASYKMAKSPALVKSECAKR